MTYVKGIIALIIIDICASIPVRTTGQLAFVFVLVICRGLNNSGYLVIWAHLLLLSLNGQHALGCTSWKYTQGYARIVKKIVWTMARHDQGLDKKIRRASTMLIAVSVGLFITIYVSHGVKLI